MKTRRLRLYAASVTSTTNAVGTTTIVRPGIITGVSWIPSIASPAAGAVIRVELSFQNTGQPTGTDVVNIISEYAGCHNLTTSGSAWNLPFCDLGLAVPVQAGDRLYMNVYISTGTPSVIAACIVSISE